MIYLAALLKPVDWLGFEVEGRGISYSGDHYYDLIGRVKVRPMEMLFFAGGWRHQDLELDEDDVQVDVEFGGPFLEAGIEF
jgi:hypothetical protein